MDSGARKIIDELKAGKFAPVYLLQGEEVFYIDLVANFIETHVLTDAEKSFNQVVLYGKDTPVNVLLTHARRFPMMAERQVVIVREAQDIPDLQRETGSRLLLDYVAHPAPTTLLVLCHKHKTLDKRRELGKKIDQLAAVATFKRPYDNQLQDFIEEYAAAKEMEIDSAAASVLAEYVGNDLSRLANEMNKVFGGLTKGEKVTAEKVMAQVGVSREYNIFELQKAMVASDVMRVARIIKFIEANAKKAQVIPLVAYLYSFFSKLLVASGAPASNEKDLVSLLKISPFAAREYSVALKRYQRAKIMNNISLLKEADLRLKGVNGGVESDGQLLKELVFRLM